jgi:hypothetical protein
MMRRSYWLGTASALHCIILLGAAVVQAQDQPPQLAPYHDPSRAEIERLYRQYDALKWRPETRGQAWDLRPREPLMNYPRGDFWIPGEFDRKQRLGR